MSTIPGLSAEQRPHPALLPYLGLPLADLRIRDQIVSALLAHDAIAVAEDLRTASTHDDLVEIGRSSLELGAATDDMAAAIGLFAHVAFGEDGARDVYRRGLLALLPRLGIVDDRALAADAAAEINAWLDTRALKAEQDERLGDDELTDEQADDRATERAIGHAIAGALTREQRTHLAGLLGSVADCCDTCAEEVYDEESEDGCGPGMLVNGTQFRGNSLRVLAERLDHVR